MPISLSHLFENDSFSDMLLLCISVLLSYMNSSFESRYPNIARWVDEHGGLIEIGYGYDTPWSSFIRGIDQGGLVVHGQDSYDTFEAAFADLDAALLEALIEIYGE